MYWIALAVELSAFPVCSAINFVTAVGIAKLVSIGRSPDKSVKADAMPNSATVGRYRVAKKR